MKYRYILLKLDSCALKAASGISSCAERGKPLLLSAIMLAYLPDAFSAPTLYKTVPSSPDRVSTVSANTPERESREETWLPLIIENRSSFVEFDESGILQE